MPTVKVFANGVEFPGVDIRSCTGGVCTTLRVASLNGISYTAGTMVNATCSVDINQPSFNCTAAQTASLQTACISAAKPVTQSKTARVSGKHRQYFSNEIKSKHATRRQ